MNFSLLFILILSVNAYLDDIQYVQIIQEPYDNYDVKLYYLLKYCQNSYIKLPYNDTHIENRHYNDTNCSEFISSNYIKVKYIPDMNIEINQKAFYIEKWYLGKDCNDKDYSIPVYMYYLYTQEHCNFEFSNFISYTDINLNEKRAYRCFGNNSNSTMCEDELSQSDNCIPLYINQCYYANIEKTLSYRFEINENKLENVICNDVDPMALLLVFIFILLLI